MPVPSEPKDHLCFSISYRNLTILEHNQWTLPNLFAAFNSSDSQMERLRSYVHNLMSIALRFDWRMLAKVSGGYKMQLIVDVLELGNTRQEAQVEAQIPLESTLLARLG